MIINAHAAASARAPRSCLAHLEQLADALLVGGEAGDFADDLAHDLDALGRALLKLVEERGGR